MAPTPFALLCALARQPGSLLSKDALLDQVWGHQFVSESVLKTAISDLRTVLGDDPRQPRVIETVPRRGYRFIAVPIAAAARAGARWRSAADPADRPAGQRPRSSAAPTRSPSSAAPGMRAYGGTAFAGLDRRRTGHRQDDADRALRRRSRRISCARGQCVEHYGTGEPYLPVLEALADLCRRDNTLPALLRAVAPTWLLQLPWLSTIEERDALRRELAGVGPERMLREMGELLDRYTAERPLLLVTEDLHWSDRSTLHLIDYIARRRGGARLMWLASFRLAEVVALDHPLNPLRHELRLHRLCDEIVLDPFSEREIADYVAVERARARARRRIRARAARAHRRRAAVRGIGLSDLGAGTLQERRCRRGAGQLENVAVPENLAAIIDHYIARLGSRRAALLATAAVCGMEFRAETIAEAIERDPAWVAETCERLDPRAGVGRGTSGRAAGPCAERPYTFRHALFRQVLYERTAPAVRAQLHRNVGAALERERERWRAASPPRSSRCISTAVASR